LKERLQPLRKPIPVALWESGGANDQANRETD